MTTPTLSELPKLSGLQPVVDKLIQFLQGSVEIKDGVSITSNKVLNLRISLVGDVIHIQTVDPKPQLNMSFILHIKRDIDGIKLSHDKIQLEINGLPDPTFPID